jgi:hypothetical protein
MVKELQMALEGLRREKAEIQSRITALDAAIGDLERNIAVLAPEIARPPVSDQPGEFSDATLREAATAVLKRATGPMPTRQLCDLLIAGGFRTAARDFYMVVYGGLKGMTNFSRTQAGHWVWQEGAEAGSYVSTKAPVTAKAKARGAER